MCPGNDPVCGLSEFLFKSSTRHALRTRVRASEEPGRSGSDWFAIRLLCQAGKPDCDTYDGPDDQRSRVSGKEGEEVERVGAPDRGSICYSTKSEEWDFGCRCCRPHCPARSHRLSEHNVYFCSTTRFIDSYNQGVSLRTTEGEGVAGRLWNGVREPFRSREPLIATVKP